MDAPGARSGAGGRAGGGLTVPGRGRPGPTFRAALAILAVIGVAFLVGCSLKKEIDTARAESEIKRGLAAQTGATLRSVTCPARVVAKKGNVFRCVAIASDHSRIPIRVTQIDNQGGVRWRVVR